MTREEKLLDSVKSLPNPTRPGALHTYVDAPFQAFAERVRTIDPLWGLRQDHPEAFSRSRAAAEWVADMASETAASEVMRLDAPYRDGFVKKVLDADCRINGGFSLWRGSFLHHLERLK